MAPNSQPFTLNYPSSLSDDLAIDFVFETRPKSQTVSTFLPPPEILAAPEEEDTPTQSAAHTYLFWQKPSNASSLELTKPLCIKQKKPPPVNIQQRKLECADKTDTQSTLTPGENPAESISNPYPDSFSTHTDSGLEKKENSLNFSDQTETTSPQMESTKTQPEHLESPSFQPTQFSSHSQEIAFDQRSAAVNDYQTAFLQDPAPIDLEKIGAIPVPHKVNRQSNEQKKLRGALTFMAWTFSLAFTFLVTLAAYGGWQLWKRIVSAESVTEAINSDLRAQIHEISDRLVKLENSHQEASVAASTLSNMRREQAAEHSLLKQSISAFAIRLEEIENNTNKRLRSMALSEQEVQNLRKEISQLRDDFYTMQNRTASDIATLQRRIQTIENFLTRNTQRSQQQQRQ